MIVKNGRLYLWYNDISTKELIIKVGSGSSSSEYVEIDQTDLVDESTHATVKVTTEANYDLWVADPVANAAVWTDKIASITPHIFDDERKIIIYVMINTAVAFELGEMGLFVIQPSEVFDDWVGETIPTSLQPSDEGNMYFTTVDSLLHTYTSGAWVDSTPSFIEQVTPDVGNTWFDTTDNTLYTYTAAVNHDYPNVMISRNLMTKQFISTTETKIIKYTINI